MTFVTSLVTAVLLAVSAPAAPTGEQCGCACCPDACACCDRGCDCCCCDECDCDDCDCCGCCESCDAGGCCAPTTTDGWVNRD